MKTLDTVVEDIYKSLEPLNSGGRLSLTEEDIDKVGEDIKEALKHWAWPSKRNSGFSMRMSNIGRPARQLWFEKKSNRVNSFKPSDQIRFLYGHILEAVVLMLVRLSGHEVTEEQKAVVVNGIKGHIDCKIDGEVVDVKTASRFGFNKFQNGSLSEDDPFGYLAQLASYEEAEGTSNGGFLVISKESGELCFYQPEELDKPNVVVKISKLRKFLDMLKPPAFCYKTIPEGKSGNMKLPKGCSFCNYKFECHKDSNDGEGLKTFKYARGPVYLTKIVSAPKVAQVL
jgi:hypothetical protein